MTHIKNKGVVLLSTYNGDRYFFEFIESLKLAREYVKDYAIIDILIRDDGSDELFVRKLKEFNQLNCDWMNIYFEGNIGSARSYMKLIGDVSDGYDFYMFADQDDIWLPKKISAVLDNISTNDPWVYASTLNIASSTLVVAKKTEIPRYMGKKNALIENVLTGCTVAVNNRMMKILKTRVNVEHIVMHDAWVYLVGSYLGNIYFDDDSYILYRQHESNVVGYKNNIMIRLLLFIKKQFRPGKNKTNFYMQSICFYKLYGEFLSIQDRILIVKYIHSVKVGGIRGACMLFKEGYKSNIGLMVTMIIYFKTLIGYGS